MGMVVRFPGRHARASAGSRAEAEGRGMSSGQGASEGQLSENHCNVRSRRSTVIPAPSSIARNFLPSRKASELTVENFNCFPLARAHTQYARATASSASVPDMDPVLVKLPGLSTAILPSAHSPAFGYFTDMELRDILAWIDVRLEAKGLSDDRASKLSRHPYVIQNMRKTLRKGHGSLPKAGTLADLARVLGEPPAGLSEPMAHTAGAEPAPPSPTAAITDLDRLRAREFELLAELSSVRTAIDMVEKIRKAG